MSGSGSVPPSTEMMYAYGPADNAATFIATQPTWMCLLYMSIAHVCCTWWGSYTYCILYNGVFEYSMCLTHTSCMMPMEGVTREGVSQVLHGFLLAGNEVAESDNDDSDNDDSDSDESDSDDTEFDDTYRHEENTTDYVAGSDQPLTHHDQTRVEEVTGVFASDSMLGLYHNTRPGLNATCRQTVALQLRVPSPDAICPISLDNISTSEVVGFEGFKLSTENPTLTEAVLPCGHSFSACYLAISWFTSAMRCPLCRAGLDVTLDIDSIPIPWRGAAKEYVERLRATEVQQQVTYTNHVDVGMHMIYALQIHMCVYLTLADGTVTAMLVDFANNTSTRQLDPDGQLSLRVTRAQVRAMSRSVIRLRATTINLVVFARRMGSDANVRLIEIAQSGPIEVPVHEPVGSSPCPGNGVPVTNVVIVQQTHMAGSDSSGVDITDTDNLATFCIHWHVFANHVFDTLIDATFCVNFSALAMFIGGVISEV